MPAESINPIKSLNYKEKIIILESLNNDCSTFDSIKVKELLDVALIDDLRIPILRKVLQIFIEIDTNISASYDLMSEAEWNVFESSDNSELETFKQHFMTLFNVLIMESNENVMNLLLPLFKVKTRNLQFLVFILAKKSPGLVFGFILKLLKKEPKIYCPFFSSLLVRLKFDSEIKQKCFSALSTFLRSKTPTRDLEYLVILQNFIYIICFKEFSSQNVDFLEEVKHLFPFLNKNVMSKYFEVFERPPCIFKSLTNEILYFFPFDLPICEFLNNLISDDYIVFE